MSALAMSLLFAGASRAGTEASLKALPDSAYTSPALRVAVTPSRKLNVLCIGSGQPTVLLDAGAGFDMVLWRHVQGQVAELTRVCAYDRAGYGFSDSMGGALDVDNVAEDIHRLVGSPAVPGPVVYVGHSIAGLYAVRLQATHPEDLIGVVLVDPAFVGQFGRMTNEFSQSSKTALLGAFARHLADLKRCNDLSSRGVLANPDDEIARSCVSASGYPETLDEELRSTLERQNAQPKVASVLLSEYSSLLAQGTMATVNDKEIGHFIQLDDPAAVVKAVQDVLHMVRAEPTETQVWREAFQSSPAHYNPLAPEFVKLLIEKFRMPPAMVEQMRPHTASGTQRVRIAVTAQGPQIRIRVSNEEGTEPTRR